MTNIILIGEKFDTYPLKSGAKHFLSLPLNIVLHVLANAVRYENEIKGIQTGKEETVLVYK